ncbi:MULTISPECIES: hypothetical protein [Lactobacillus]|jgi:acid stress-induced BolA-like protein IbaG/YrbA|uniref:Uncharacterized protein n=1 Tax=Lactobacillus paragasseri TaxID=2107999 RepID=A0AAW6XUP1_9LACO|nr:MULTISPECIES: hypothetical protein [Lactobacillus]MCQ5246553.1 hypothetical protein [Lactobacillus gasseri]MDK6869437.1 hypothetical protein [Lactobacillus paragasseri]VEF35756.1 XRE family transcriptional regulator [Lactobacillus paragasseri]
MIKSTILESLKFYKEYLNGNDSHVEAVEVSNQNSGKNSEIKKSC